MGGAGSALRGHLPRHRGVLRARRGDGAADAQGRGAQRAIGGGAL